MTLEEYQKQQEEADLNRLKKGYLTPRKYSNLLQKKALAERAAEQLARLERGETFEDNLRMVLHAYSAVMHWSEDLNHRVGGLAEQAPLELRGAITALESLAQQLEDLALYSEEANEVSEALETQAKLWDLPEVSEETLKD